MNTADPTDEVCPKTAISIRNQLTDSEFQSMPDEIPTASGLPAPLKPYSESPESGPDEFSGGTGNAGTWPRSRWVTETEHI